jgi:hypothetical protein
MTRIRHPFDFEAEIGKGRRPAQRRPGADDDA